jgi:aralkylamine N-acetyltransferase
MLYSLYSFYQKLSFYQFNTNKLFAMPFYQFLQTPTHDQIDQLITLYQEAGWWSSEIDTSDVLKGIISGSHGFCVAVIENKIVGMGRSISDGVSDAYIQDVAVTKSFRRKGIASGIVTELIKKLEADGIGWIGLIAEKGSAEYYRPLGFDPMPNSTPMLRLRKL